MSGLSRPKVRWFEVRLVSALKCCLSRQGVLYSWRPSKLRSIFLQLVVQQMLHCNLRLFVLRITSSATSDKFSWCKKLVDVINFLLFVPWKFVACGGCNNEQQMFLQRKHVQSDCFCSLNLLLCGRVPSPWSLLKGEVHVHVSWGFWHFVVKMVRQYLHLVTK